MRLLLCLCTLVVFVWAAELSPDLGLGFRYDEERRNIEAHCLIECSSLIIARFFSQAQIGSTISD